MEHVEMRRPNLMIYAIAVERGVAMPSFFGWVGTVPILRLLDGSNFG
jgi:hypothetical protein